MILPYEAKAPIVLGKC